MSRTPEKVNVKDDYGQTHSYLLVPLPAELGVKIMARIAKPLMSAMTGALSSLGDLKAETLENVDFAGLGLSLERVLDVVIDNGDAAFFKLLLTGSHRFEKGDDKAGAKDPSGVLFDVIYLANYGELIGVIGHILKLNFGPMVERFMGNAPSGILKSFKDLRSSMTLTGLQTMNAASTSSEPATSMG